MQSRLKQCKMHFRKKTSIEKNSILNNRASMIKELEDLTRALEGVSTL